MKRSFLLIIFISFLSIGANAQTTVDVFINGIKAGQYNINADQTDGGISYKKSTYKKVDRLTIQIKGKSVDGGYFRKVEVMGDDEKPLYIANETEGAAGQFVLTNEAVLNRLSKGKSLKLIVEKTPANTKSMEASRKIYIGTLSRTK